MVIHFDLEWDLVGYSAQPFDSCINLTQKIGGRETLWKFSEKTIFGLILTTDLLEIHVHMLFFVKKIK